MLDGKSREISKATTIGTQSSTTTRHGYQYPLRLPVQEQSRQTKGKGLTAAKWQPVSRTSDAHLQGAETESVRTVNAYVQWVGLAHLREDMRSLCRVCVVCECEPQYETTGIEVLESRSSSTITRR